MSRMTTNHDQFAHCGSPWATDRDWQREVALAQNPKANTALRRSASDYTDGRSKNQPLPSRVVPEPRPIPKTVDRAKGEHQRRVYYAVERELARLMAPGGDQTPRPKARVFVPAQAQAQAQTQAPSVDPMDKTRRQLLIQFGKNNVKMSLNQWCDVFRLFGSYAAFQASF